MMWFHMDDENDHTNYTVYFPWGEEWVITCDNDQTCVKSRCPICHDTPIMTYFMENGMFDCRHNPIDENTVQICEDCMHHLESISFGPTSLEQVLASYCKGICEECHISIDDCAILHPHWRRC